MTRFPLLVLLTTFSLLGINSPARSASSAEVAPPAADETLIYVMRENIGGGKYWITVNDQAVGRVKNKRYAVVRAKSGRITLSLNTQGIVPAAITLDDLPGKTIYLKWRLPGTSLQIITKREGQEFIAKHKRTKDIEKKPLGNFLELVPLMNLSRMGLYNITRRASQTPKADSEHAVITLFRREDGPRMQFGIWGERGFLGTLLSEEGIRLRVPPGNYYFSANQRYSIPLLKAEVEAGKEYFAWLDYGLRSQKVRWRPMPVKEVKKLKSWLEGVEWVEVAEDEMTPRIRERESIVTEYIQGMVKLADSGEKDFSLLGKEHAFSDEMLKEHQIDLLVTKN